ncbi:hypothetical protein SAMN05421821_102592 [Mucilaginibacter lappiensis]|uniref:Uncharacterized protein n=1 Tax=Mucilaginibacter lappiensis TaxID=354630 RepID=A0ABR6PEK5_9SPHI|nr:hypothetical protein [Mucilaginibacter lappiensis]SIQ49124.1 hypothetical protein SAMN05421821_102592 [Mucilaginibacter lappiensis]
MLTVKSVNHVNPLFNKMACLFGNYAYPHLLNTMPKALTCNKFVKSGLLLFLMINK